MTGLPAAVTTKANELIPKLDALKTGGATNTPTQVRLFNELLREIAASGWGRRDALWALKKALAGAQRFVYIETPGLTESAEPSHPGVLPALPPFAVELFDALAGALQRGGLAPQ